VIIVPICNVALQQNKVSFVLNLTDPLFLFYLAFSSRPENAGELSVDPLIASAHLHSNL